MKVMIGLETHVQLNTKTKMFCGCSIKNIPDEPNSRCCPTCLGMPGSKPSLNRAALDAGVKIALALGCEVSGEVIFSRKTYFYPDMAKNYQITQYEIPIAKEGSFETIDSNEKAKTIRIRRINLEEDPAKLHHEGGDITTADYVLIDYNRSGIPLCEIVTEPDISSPREARIFLQRLSTALEYLGVFSKGEMSLRTDANVSVEGNNRVEIKNITSFADVEKALDYEIERQSNVIDRGGSIESQTMAWDSKHGVTKAMRKKETEEDYGYIFEPDLVAVDVKIEALKDIRKNLPEMPQQRYERYLARYKLSKELASMITSEFKLSNLYEKLIENQKPGFVASWIMILKKTLDYNRMELDDSKINIENFLKLLDLVSKGDLTDSGAEMILREIINKPEEFDNLIEKYSAKIENIDEMVDELLKEEGEAVQSYANGTEKAMTYLIGKLIAKSQNRIDANKAREILEKKISKS